MVDVVQSFGALVRSQVRLRTDDCHMCAEVEGRCPCCSPESQEDCKHCNRTRKCSHCDGTQKLVPAVYSCQVVAETLSAWFVWMAQARAQGEEARFEEMWAVVQDWLAEGFRAQLRDYQKSGTDVAQAVLEQMQVLTEELNGASATVTLSSGALSEAELIELGVFDPED